MRGLLATPIFLAYSFLVWASEIIDRGGLAGLVLLALGAIVAGYLIRSPWAMLIAVPFAGAGIAYLDTSVSGIDSFGLLILLAVALPITVGAGLGVLIGALSRRR